MIEHIQSLILKHGLYLIPLYSIENGLCTCKKADCASPGKHPLMRFNWKQVATNKPERIKEWLDQYQRLNFAIATGRKAKDNGKFLVVVDVDAKEHDIIKTLPETFAYRTGGGGYHFWFWTDIPVRNSVSLIADKVDIRGTDGYVVVPPSRHKSGKNYAIISTAEIADMPASLIKLVKKAHFDKKRKTAVSSETVASGDAEESAVDKKTKTVISQLVTTWGLLTVPQVRAKIASGELIPTGVRNVTIHRLLSSDRAKGLAERDDVLSKAVEYKAFLEDSTSFSHSELEGIIDSVMKYQPYNTSYEKVNLHYTKWLKRNGHKVSEAFEEALVNLDNRFFAGLSTVPCDTFKGVSLKDVADKRAEYMKLNGLQQFSVYKPSLLGTKLKELGFTRLRTSKCNVWNIGFDNLFKP